MSVKNLTFVNNNPPACDDEFLNSVRNETNNAITQSGQSLTGIGDSEQLSKGISNYVASGAFYGCTNVADAYTLTPISPFKGITGYKDGQLVRFRPSATNTTQTPTVNVNSQGVKNITKADGSTQVDIGDIDSNQDIELRYDLANDVFVLPKLGVTSLIPTLYIGGIKTENDSGDTAHDIKFNVGSCRDIADTQDIVLGSAIIKRVDANWAAGTGNGGFPSGITLTANTWYYFFVIAKPDGTVDAGFDSSLSATNLLADATGYTKYRRVGSMKTDVSANWLQYYQQKERFILKTSISSSTAQNAYPTLTTVDTPVGIITTAILNFIITGNAIVTHGATSPTINDNLQSVIGTSSSDQKHMIAYIETNTSSQINEGRTSFSGGTYTYDIRTLGWVDIRE